MSQSNSALHLGVITVRQLNGLFCLNDLHKASGRNPSHRPGNFLQIDQTKALIAEIETAEIPAVSSREGRAMETAEIPAVFSKEGRTGGTYACRELVIAYAAWINPAFHLKVLRAFLDTATPAHSAAPAATTQTLLPSEKGCRSILLNPSERELIEMLRWTTYGWRYGKEHRPRQGRAGACDDEMRRVIHTNKQNIRKTCALQRNLTYNSSIEVSLQPQFRISHD